MRSVFASKIDLGSMHPHLLTHCWRGCHGQRRGRSDHPPFAEEQRVTVNAPWPAR